MNRMKLLALAGALFTAGAAYTATAATATVSRTNEPTTPVLADFNSQFANHPSKAGYNTNVPDRMFLDSLPVKCAAPQRITSAQFTIDVVKLTQGANRGDNDGLAFWNNPTSLFSTHMWTAAEPPNTPKQLTYNLGALPGLGAGQLGSNVLNNSIPGASMLASMQTNGRFSFSVQDDTMVRRATLTYTCEGGRVAVDSGVIVAPPVVAASDTSSNCNCSQATLLNTPAKVTFASFPSTPANDLNVTVGAGYELLSTPGIAPSWQAPQRFQIDISTNKIRLEMARDAFYGAGSILHFALKPTGAAPCTASLASATFSSNRSDAMPTVNSSTVVGNTVHLNIQNGILGDWRKGDWIEADLKFKCAAIGTPNVGITPVVTTPINLCAPGKVCFNVDVFNGPVQTAPATVTFQPTQNGSPVGPLQTQMVNADGQICFSAGPVPPGQGWDYVVKASFPIPGAPPQIITLNSPVPGPNNDLVCAQNNADCCPKFMQAWNLDQPTSMYFGGMFSANVPMGGGNYPITFQGSATNAQTLANNLKQWVEWLKFDSGCSSLIGFRVEMQPWKSNQTTSSTPPPYLLPPVGPPAMTSAGSSQFVTMISGNVTPLILTWPNIAQSPFYHYMSFKLIPIGPHNQPVTCNIGKCAEEMFTRWHIGSGAAAKAGSGGSLPVIFD